jgi:hypothetical protein
MAGNSAINLCTNAAAGTYTANIQLGGQYMLLMKGTWGSAQFNVIDPSGNTIPYGSAITANGATLVQLPTGKVSLVCTGGSAYTANLVGVPTNTTR